MPDEDFEPRPTYTVIIATAGHARSGIRARAVVTIWGDGPDPDSFMLGQAGRGFTRGTIDVFHLHDQPARRRRRGRVTGIELALGHSGADTGWAVDWLYVIAHHSRASLFFRAADALWGARANSFCQPIQGRSSRSTPEPIRSF